MATLRPAALHPGKDDTKQPSMFSNENGKAVPVVVVRPYNPATDRMAVQTLLSDVAMETVWDYYMQAALSALTPQLCFAGFAIGFLLIGWPFYGCLSLAPVPMVLMYFFIWSAHYMKGMELSQDVNNISNAYMQNPDTNFWVAEVYDNVLSNELSAHFNMTKKVQYQFYTREDLGPRELELKERFTHRILVGCVGVARSEISNTKAWLKRFTVSKVYRRRGIGQFLLEAAIKFSSDNDFIALELVATDCHYQARELFCKRGFSALMGHRGFLGITQQRYIFSLPLKSKANSAASKSVDTTVSAAPESTAGIYKKFD